MLFTIFDDVARKSYPKPVLWWPPHLSFQELWLHLFTKEMINGWFLQWYCKHKQLSFKIKHFLNDFFFSGRGLFNWSFLLLIIWNAWWREVVCKISSLNPYLFHIWVWYVDPFVKLLEKTHTLWSNLWSKHFWWSNVSSHGDGSEKKIHIWWGWVCERNWREVGGAIPSFSGDGKKS